ncbi:MAG: sigma-70 family RNA polymerase sigma factor [Pirellulales bacterium]
MDTSIDSAPSTGELVLAAQSGDRQALGELFLRFRPTIIALALRRLGNLAEAQELSQEVFIQAMQKLDQLRAPECFAGWIRSITVRMAINRAVRRAPMLATEPQTLESTCIDRRTPAAAAVAGEQAQGVRDGLKRLRSLDRDTLEAFYVRGQSLNEMSAEFDAPVGTIKRRLHVARQRLARELEHLVGV